MRKSFTSKRKTLAKDRPEERPLRNVLLWITRDYEVGRAILRGIIAFVGHKRSWVLHNHIPTRHLAAYLARLNPDGVIAQVTTANASQALASLGKPVVNVSNLFAQCPFPRVCIDNKMIGRLAAEHLLDRGLRHFAFIGHRHQANSEQRAEGFALRLRQSGYSCHYYLRAAPSQIPGSEAWQATIPHLADFMANLPKPVGVFARNGPVANDVSETCRLLGLEVPNQVAIVGADNDPLLSALAQPPLSSVEVPAEQIGFRAALLLQSMMDGKPPPKSTIVIPPVRVVSRQSSDVLAVQDADLRCALQFIRTRSGEPIGVGDVLREVPISRRSLEQRFMLTLGRTPAQEIVRVHVQMAKELLTDTDLAMPVVAERSGFTCSSRMSEVFRRVVGVTPTAYRQRGRLS